MKPMHKSSELSRRSPLILTLSGTILLTSLFSCQAVEESKTPPPIAATKLSVSVLPYLSFSPLEIARVEGYFELEGIEIEFLPIGMSDSIIAAGSGDLDVGAILVSPGIFNASRRGADLRIVADKGSVPMEGCANEWFLVRSELSDDLLDDIESAKQLTWSNVPTSPFDLAVDKVLKDIGSSSLEVPSVNVSGPSALAAFASGELDVALIADPHATNIVEAGVARKWKDLSEVVPGAQIAVIIYGSRLLQDRELGTRFMRAYLRGVAQYREGKTPRNIEIISVFSGVTPEIIEATCWPFIRENGALSPAALRNYMEWAVERGYIDGLVDESIYYDPEFVQKAAEQLGAN